MKMCCPHCQTAATIRTSRTLSPLSREIYYQCTNVFCGHTWRSLLSAVRTIVPSQTPNPSVFISVSERSRKANTNDDQQSLELERAGQQAAGPPTS